MPMILFGLPAFLLGLNALAGDKKQIIEGEFEIEVDVDAESSFANKGGEQ